MSLANAMNWPVRRPVTSLVLVAILAAGSLLLVVRLKPDVSLQALTSSNDPSAKALDRVLNEFPVAEEMLVLATLQPDGPADTERLIAYAQRLEQAIAKDPQASGQVVAVNYRPDAKSREFVEKVMAPAGMFYLSDAEFAAAQQRLTRQGMAGQFQRDEQLMAAPGPAATAMAKAIMQDPLRLHEFLLKRLSSLGPMQGVGSSDAFVSPDGRSLLIRIAAAQPPGNIEFATEFSGLIETLAARSNTDRLRLDISGAYPIAARSAQAIRHDSILSVITSVLGLGMLFALAFRRPVRHFALAMLPVGLGVLLGLAAFSLFQRTLTPLTAVIGGVLAGIGIDYSIQYLAHYDRHRRSGQDAAGAATETMRTIGGPLVAAWATSVIGFFAIAVSSIRLLRDFAIVGSLGLAGAFACTIVVLPAVLVLSDRGTGPRRPALRFGANFLVRFAQKGKFVVVPLCIVIAMVPLIWLAWDRSSLDLDSDMTILHPRPNRPLDAEQTISKRMGTSPGSLIVYLRAESNEQLVELAHDVQSHLSSTEASRAGVSGTLGLASVLPDPRVVARRVAATGPDYARKVLADFDSIVEQSPFSAEQFAGYKSFLEALLTRRQVPGVQTLLQYPQFRDALLPRNQLPGETAEAITLVFTKDSLELRADRERVLAAVRAQLKDLPGATLTGMAVIGSDMDATIRHDLPRLAAFALVVVCLYLIVQFRSVTTALTALVPTIFSLTCVLGALELSGQRLNLVNIIAVPLLIGIDVDYGIFMVGTVLSGTDKDRMSANIATSAQAILLCAASAALGFGSIDFTSIPAVQSLGLAVIVGVVACALGAILLLVPVLFRARQAAGPSITSSLPSESPRCSAGE